MMWREKRVLLAVLGVLLAANTIFFFTYRVQYETRLRDLDAQLDSVKGELEAARHARVAAEQQLAGYRKVEKDIRQIYDVEWATEQQRLAPFITEVMKLGAVSELVPRSTAMQRTASNKGAVRTTGGTATEVGISFNVEGSYQQVRRLINLLEVSDQFIIIDQVSLGSESGDRLTLNIRLKTLFRDAPAPPKSSNQEL
jgi:hypothetical protein